MTEANDMRRMTNATVVVLMGLVAGAAAGEPFVLSFHEASGSGTANVFDGGPPVFDEGQTFGDTDDRMSFLAIDATQSGSDAALAIAAGQSRMTLPVQDDQLRLRVDLIAWYRPEVGGDNPGGMAEAELSSVIEFVMPVDELEWFYRLRIDEDFPFQGSTSVVFENVTQSEVLLELDAQIPGVTTTLVGHVGDVMRLTTFMSGSGSMGPGSFKEYETRILMDFTVPEPGTVFLFLAGALTAAARRNRG